MTKVAEKLDEPRTQDGQSPPDRQPIQNAPPIEADDSHVLATYTNFCRVTGTPEELIVDFGLNPQIASVPSQPVKLSQRVVMNFFTAKRLLGALQVSISRHEQAFGVLETNIQKRVNQPR